MKMKKFILILVILSINIAFSQKIILDSISNKGIPYVNISIKNTEKGFYSNKNGEFHLKEFIKKGDTLIFSSMGYNNKVIVFKKLNQINNIFLSKNIEKLEEVVINLNQKYQEKELGLIKRKGKRSSGAMSIIKLAVLIKNDSTKKKTGIINELIFKRLKVKFKTNKFHYFKNGTFKKEKNKTNTDLAISLQLYAIDQNTKLPNLNLPLIPIKKIIRLSQNKKKLTYDISSFNIEMPKKGVFVTLEVLGFYNKKGEIEDPKFKNIFKFGISKVTNSHKSFTYARYKNRSWNKLSSNALFSIKVKYPID